MYGSVWNIFRQVGAQMGKHGLLLCVNFILLCCSTSACYNSIQGRTSRSNGVHSTPCNPGDSEISSRAGHIFLSLFLQMLPQCLTNRLTSSRSAQFSIHLLESFCLPKLHSLITHWRKDLKYLFFPLTQQSFKRCTNECLHWSNKF
jgi:hypothetical protein